MTELLAVLAAKTVRTFCYGFLGLVLPLYLAELGLDAAGVGVAVTLTLLGSAALTWAVRRPAERLGGRVALTGLAALSGFAASVLMLSSSPWVVVAAAMIGNVAVGTGETGPFLALEQVVVARAVAGRRRTAALSLYNLLGYAAAALGALTAPRLAYPLLFGLFLAAAVVQVIAYQVLRDARPPARVADAHGRPGSTPLIRRLAALFSLDSFAGGFVLQSLVAYFLHARYGLDLEALGLTFAVAQLLTAVSLVLAVPLAGRFGLLPTMVVSHLLSNMVLIAIAVAPTAAVAIALLWTRHLLSQMDVPTRQAYLMAVVEDHEREAAASLTNLTRTLAQAVSPALTGWVMGTLALSAPFVLGGGLKIVYDVLLFVMLRHVPLKEPE